MIRVELQSQLLRLRTLIVLGFLAVLPVVAALATASNAGHRNGTQGGLFGASTYSALNHTVASLEFIGPLLLPLAVALLCTAIGASDRDWGILRYLYIQPVTTRRLLTGKLGAVIISAAAATGCVLLGGLVIGLAVFGWHPFHVLGAPTLSISESLTRFVAASGYTLLCMLSMGTVALTLGLALPRGPEALGASIAYVIVASILNGQHAVHLLNAVLPVHYWQNWTNLWDAQPAHLGIGAAVQVVSILLAGGGGVLILRRRDPAG